MTTIIQEAWNMDIFAYFQRLIQLKPHFVVFPLEDNTFNKCKSNIAAIEATVAGAVCIAPEYMPEFLKIADGYKTVSELENLLFNISDSKAVLGFTRSTYKDQKTYIETNLRLSEINKIRIRIAAEITGKIPTA